MTRRQRLARHGLRAVRVVLALVVVATFLDAGPVRAQDEEAVETTLAGYQGSAAASGVHAFYNIEGLLPIPPPVDLGAPDALATIASGPATFARAGVVDPGDLLANPDALLALFSSDYPPGTLPPFPYRVTAASGSGAPSAESNPAPGLNARVVAGETGSTARASMPGLDAPAVASAGAITSQATTSTDGSTVTVRARTVTTGFDLLGLVTIDSVVTDVTATSSGGEVALSGGTKVVGASVLGLPVVIDRDGIHTMPGQVPLLDGLLGGVVDSLDDVLNQVGITITVAGPVELSGDRTGQLGAAGLRIDLELSRTTLPQLAALLDSIPPVDAPIPGAPGLEDVLVVAQARHLVSIEVGRGVVSLAATSVGDEGGDDLELPDLAQDPTFDVPPTFSDLGIGGLPTPAPPAVDVPVQRTDAPKVPAGAGVGALVLLALLATPFVGERLAWACAAILAADRPDSCAEEP